MAFKKITVGNGVRYFPKSHQSKEKVFKPNTIKNNSNPRKQKLNLSQNKKEFPNNVAAQGFAILK